MSHPRASKAEDCSRDIQTAARRKRVAILITTMGYGSSLLYWEPILREFLKKIPDSRIYTSGRKTLNDEWPLPLDLSVKLWRIPLPRPSSDYVRHAIVINPLIIVRVLRYKPDLLVVSEFGLLSIYAIIIGLLRPRTRILLLIESDPRGLARGIFNALRVCLRRWICRHSTLILTNNEAGKRYLAERLRVTPGKIRQGVYLVSQPAVPSCDNSTQITMASPPPLLTPDSQPLIFLYVGQLIERKGLQFLILAMSSLPEEYRQRCIIWIIGDGEFRDTLEQLIRNQGVADRIILHGRKPYGKLPDFYRAADVFVLPTLHDYRALVGFEALQFGLPLLQSKLDGAASEIVMEGRNGFTFDPYDVGALGEHIKWFIDHRALLPAFSRCSRGLSTRYTVHNAADNLVAAAQEALDG